MDKFLRKRGRDQDSPNHDQERPENRPKKSNLDTSDDASNEQDANEQDAKLASLLDFTSLTTLPDISARFDELANALLFDFRLSVTCDSEQIELDILELEFYLKKPGCHADPFTHGSEEQKKSGQWYFHRVPRRSGDPSGGEYKGGTRKGLDLTFGGPVLSPYFAPSLPQSNPQGTYGGILLRTVRHSSGSKVISGPCLLVDEILRLSKSSSISELVGQKWNDNLSALQASPCPETPARTSLRLRRKPVASGSQIPPVYRSPRVGLELSHPSTKSSATDPRVIFVSKPYRYFIHPELLTSKGRIHTFLGVYRACSESEKLAGNEARIKREVMRLTGLKEPTVIKYHKDYQSGVDGGDLAQFVGAGGKGASASPSMCLNMMGAVEKVLCSAQPRGTT